MARLHQLRKKSIGILILFGLALTIHLSLSYILTYLQHKEGTSEDRNMYRANSAFELRSEDVEKLQTLKQPCVTNQTWPRSLRNGMWYLTTGLAENKSSIEISVYGAYLDTRNQSLLIRVFGISNSTAETPVHCLVWYLGHDEAVESVATVDDTGRGLYNNKIEYQERMYTCRLPSEIAVYPKSVALTFEACNYSNSSNPIPIIVPSLTNSIQHDIGLCTAVTYGFIDALWLVEWIEFNRLLGVTEINFYTNNLSHDVTTELSYYTKTGLVKTKSVTDPIAHSCHWCLKLATIPVLNDCMYRNMYRYRYVAVTDIDEIIIPKRHDTLRDLLRHLDVFYPSPSYMFRNAYFFFDLPSAVRENKSNISMMLKTITKLKRLKPSERGYASKSIINPRLCEVVQNHICIRRTPDVSKFYWATEVKEDLGLLHHYKKCHFEPHECKRIVVDYHTDNSVRRFSDNLLFNVRKTLANINLTIRSV